MNVLMVIGQYNPIKGGAEVQAERLSLELKKQGINVDVLTYHRRGLNKVEVIDGIKIYRLRGFLYKKIKLYSLILSIIIFIFKNRKKYDVIHIHQGLVPAFAGVFAANICGLPSIVKIANSSEKFDLNVLENNFIFGSYMANKIIKYTTVFIAIAPNIVKEIKEKGVDEKRIRLIPNGINEIKTKSKKLIKNHYIVVSRLVEQKNLFFLLDILYKLEFSYEVKIFGSGPLKDELESYIAKLSLEDKVFLMDTVSSSELNIAYEESDIFLLPSLHEGLSNALLEAMSYGVLPIVSDIPGNKFALGSELSEKLCLPFDKNKWIELIGNYMNNNVEKEKIKMKSKQRAKEFNINNISKKYIKLYKELNCINK